MRTSIHALTAAAVVASVVAIARPLVAEQAPQSNAVPPPWAYTVASPPPPNAPAPEPPTTVKHVPGSSVTMTLADLRDAFAPPDWHPDGHPAPPPVVAHGRKPDLRACGYCHYPNGQGRPENASLAGLPVDYIVQQMADFRSGARKSAEPKMRPPAAMIAVAKASTVEEDRQAAEYFASLPYKPWMRVVETDTISKMRIAGGVHVPIEGAGTEPIGMRIIEAPEDPARAALRDSASGFITYVPKGSIDKGKALVTTGGSKTTACGTCHGADLKGLGPVPPLAGRSASYTVRQLFDFQQGVRKGPWSALMKSAVEKLSIEDMVAIAAYTASRQP